MKILAIDTCTKNASCTILENEKILAHFFINSNITHSETIIVMIENCLSTLKLDINQIDEFICTNGPGSFTGVRIGLSIIKGFFIGLKKPCYTVSSLLSLAYNCLDLEGQIIMPILDAKRKQFYTALFKIENSSVVRLHNDIAINIDEIQNFCKNYNQKIFILGDGINEYKKNYKKNDKFIILSQNLVYNSSLGAALSYTNKNNISNTLEPSYIRLSQAQQDLNKNLER